MMAGQLWVASRTARICELRRMLKGAEAALAWGWVSAADIEEWEQIRKDIAAQIEYEQFTQITEGR